MWISRVTIRGLLIAVAVIAVDCYLIVEVFNGVLLPAIGLNVGLFRILRGHGRGRRFWIAFEVAGLPMLGLYLWLLANMEDLVALWPTSVLSNLLDRLPPATQDRLLQIQDNYFGFMVVEIILFETTIGLPLLLSSALGGWLGSRIVPGPATHAGPVESPKPSPGLNGPESALSLRIPES